MKKQPSSITDFGFQQIPIHEKEKKVAEVFHNVADQYDLMNDLMSLGIHRLWKRYALQVCALRKGQTVLDLAGGTGDLSAAISKAVGAQGKVTLSDINSSMLVKGRARLLDEGIFANMNFILANAEQLPFASDYFDRCIMGFGLRNVTHKSLALAQIYRVLKPGGKIIILEFSHPQYEWLKKIYDLYSFNVLPWLGKLIVNDANSYQYLAESIRMHPNQNTLQQMMEDVGFEQCAYQNLSGGIVAVHHGYKL